MAPLLDVEGLRTAMPTRGTTVYPVSGVDLQVEAGQSVGIVGESGCGKSMTLRSILGLVPAPGRVIGGRVSFNGQDLRSMSQREIRAIRGLDIGFVTQNPFDTLHPVIRIWKQAHHVASAHASWSRRETRERFEVLLERVGIPDPTRVMDGYPHQLSGGMAQRVCIAMALLLDPSLVVADEPTTALDVTVQRRVLETLVAQVRATNRSLLMVTHDLSVVAQYCDRVVVLYAGRVVEDGTVHQVFVQPAHPYTRALLSAIPEPGRALRPLRGQPPSLDALPAGCRFSSRCPHVVDTCHQAEPRLALVEEGHRAACILVGKE